MSESKERIKKTFDDVAKDYDKNRKLFIPCFDDFYSTAVSVIEPITETPLVLDLGAGTGILAEFFLKKHPSATMTLLDLSDEMLEVAKERFAEKSNVLYATGDYVDSDLPGEFDVIISGMSIHHLSPEQKETLYHRCFQALRPGGSFVNADQALGDTPYLDALYKKRWRELVRQSGIKQDEIEAWVERMKIDREGLLEPQLSWLRDAGFTDVACSYRFLNFVVFSGRKP